MDITVYQAAAFEVFLAASVGYFIKRMEKRSMERDEKRRAEENDRLAKEQERAARMAVVEEALCAMLRDRIIQSCRYFISKGTVPPFERENIERMYHAYHDGLGGNDIASDIYNKMKELPLEAYHE